MRAWTTVAAGWVSLCILAVPLAADEDASAFLGRWNMTSVDRDPPHVYWLEVTEENGAIAGSFLNRGGNPNPLPEIAIDDDELVFRVGGPPDRPGPEFRARREGDELVGTVTARGETIAWVGRRPPDWGDVDANADHSFGTPVELFDGSLDAWDVQHEGRPSGWSVVDGAMTNEAKANNLVSRQTFSDFKIEAEYKLEPESNSGIYLRGRYELQVLDDHDQPATDRGHMSLYGWTPPLVNAGKPAGEWQTLEAIIVGNRLTATLNGQTVHDNTEIQAITGGALDADETEPGPIMLQGDHGKVWFREITVTPIVE